MSSQPKLVEQLRFASLFLYFVSILTIPSYAWAQWGKGAEFGEIPHHSKVSIGFASQNLKSPVSSFGHTFIVFHNDESPEADSLVVEFTGEANGALENVSALFNSVPGKYSLSYFADKARYYDYENRSIWIYPTHLSDFEIAQLKQFLINANGEIFPYDFSQKNCAFYIAHALSHGRNSIKYKKYGLFVTPVDSLRWARAEGLLSTNHFYFPSSQLVAINSYDGLAEGEKELVVESLEKGITLDKMQVNSRIGNALSDISDHLIKREDDANKRNQLFKIKRDFSSSSNVLAQPIVEPSRSFGLGTASIMARDGGHAALISVSPGFIQIDNERASNSHNAAFEVMRADISIAENGHAAVERFNLLRIESNQYGGYLRDGFTQALELSFADYGPFHVKQYKEAKATFGRGESWLLKGHTFSILPIVSVLKSWNGMDRGMGRAELRIGGYKQISDRTTYVFHVNQVVTKKDEIKRTSDFDLVYSIKESTSIAINIKSVKSSINDVTIFGIRVTQLF